MKAKYLIMSSIVTFFMLVNFFSFADDTTEYFAKHREIALRNIGHQLLLKTQDSTSTVLPVKTIRENLYQIEFQSQFSFVDDTLINLVQKQIKASQLPNEYIVSVLDCNNQKLVFGYEVSLKKGDTIACSGRSQPKGCYVVQIEFFAEKESNNAAFLLLLIPFAFIAYRVRKKVLSGKNISENIENESLMSIGAFKFNPQANILFYENTKTELTEKESKLLLFLQKNINNTTDREELMSEIWGNDGIVVVGRSLDVLVSKLRKKLEPDSRIKILNVHGKGYKLVV
jgi:DNA-binding winged helix-turn-helix (wHTH) protein